MSLIVPAELHKDAEEALKYLMIFKVFSDLGVNVSEFRSVRDLPIYNSSYTDQGYMNFEPMEFVLDLISRLFDTTLYTEETTEHNEWNEILDDVIFSAESFKMPYLKELNDGQINSVIQVDCDLLGIDLREIYNNCDYYEKYKYSLYSETELTRFEQNRHRGLFNYCLDEEYGGELYCCPSDDRCRLYILYNSYDIFYRPTLLCLFMAELYKELNRSGK